MADLSDDPALRLAAASWERRGDAPSAGELLHDTALPRSSSAGREIVLFGLWGGLLIAGLQLVEYRFLVLDRSAAAYGAIVAALFAGIGIWLGRTLQGGAPTVVVREVPVPVAVPVEVPIEVQVEVPVERPFVVDAARIHALELTPRELEILGRIAEGLSNQEIARRLFVSANTVKTHASRVFAKLGARRRTEAVRIGKAWRLIP